MVTTTATVDVGQSQSRRNGKIKKKDLLIQIFIDICCIACVGFTVMIVYLTAEPYERGFYCDDESLMHPKKDNTIPTWVAGFVGIVVPTICVFVIEPLRERRLNFLKIYSTLVVFYFGCAMAQLTSEISKYMVGRLRPHFLTVCKPNITSCTSSTGFILGDVCTGTDKEAIREARLSFPSGHTNISFYCMVYLMIYLQMRWKWKSLWMARPLLQLIAFYLAYLCGLSRISDYMHHWSDVLGGAIIGTVVAICVAYFVSDLFGQSQAKAYSKSVPQHDGVHNTSTSSESESHMIGAGRQNSYMPPTSISVQV